MKKKAVALLSAIVIGAMCVSGCGNGGQVKASDQAAADQVAALIDAIYVQQRTDETDKQCEAAKAAWDALTDVQKQLVKGVNADPDYFGRDTGDASKDDALNQDGIGEKEILVVSFGTSFNDSRVADIKGIEDALIQAYPEWSVRRAFTAQIIINHVQARDGEKIDNVEQALERAAANGVKTLVIQPTHLMHGAEYDELMDAVEVYRDQFAEVKIAEPLLGEVGNDAYVINADKKAVAEILTAEAVKDAGYASLDAAKNDQAAFVFLGHGTAHVAKVSYSQMKTQFGELGFQNVFVGTVEGEPEDTSCENVMEAAAAAGYKKIILRPLMVVAGDHANNDMAGEDEDSWKSQFIASKEFESVDAQIVGLGSVDAIQQLYVAHVADAMKASDEKSGAAAGTLTELTDGTYLAKFETDSGMFHVNEALNGKGTLTVKDGEMMIHISLGSKKIVNLYYGLAADADKEGAKLLNRTEDTVTYPDGLTEEVYGFDVPVPAIDQEFDVALVGTKGTWYDHKVKVVSPEPIGEGSAEGANDKVDLNSLPDGIYSIDHTFTGGSGKAQILSPVTLRVENHVVTAVLNWNSPNYDYMIVDGVKYLPVNAEGNSVFEIPVTFLDGEISVIGDTVAMNKPHEIEYTLTFHSETLAKVE